MYFNKKESIKAYAKINFFLDIEGKREDGYHNIKSIMQTVSLHDVVTVSIKEKTDIAELTCTDRDIPCDSANLANKAALAYKNATKLSFGTVISIDKRIPRAAGLGGGSADAAAVLVLLNRLTGINMSDKELAEIGAQVGADVPFCVFGGTKIARGIGEIITDLPPCPNIIVVIAVKGENISTPLAYRQLDMIYDEFANFKSKNDTRFNCLLGAFDDSNINMISNNMYNIFESVVKSKRADIEDIKRVFTANGAIGTIMSGSGPSVFGLFEEKSCADNACGCLKKLGAAAFVCKTIN